MTLNGFMWWVQVAIAMLVWNVIQPNGAGWLGGIVSGAVFMIPCVALWRAKALFDTTGSVAAGAVD